MNTATFEQDNMLPSVDNKRRDSISSQGPPKKKIRTIASSSLPLRQQADADENATHSRESSPQEYLMDTLKSMGSVVQIYSSLEMKGFFAAPTKEEISAYGIDVITAIGASDIKKLREYHESGRPLKSSNKFGESLLHLACRRGFVDVTSFLIKDAGVTVRVIDDYGRTPLHDACWTCEPNFELFELLVTACPDLLFMRDRRGNTPLEYARREQWGAYIKFLSERQELFCRNKHVAVAG
jgi:ankyrin repeat protein